MSGNLSEKSEGMKPEKVQSFDTELVEKIKYGFENNEFKMHLQFVVDRKTGEIASAEALSRWENSQGETIFPGTYIGVMEASGLIVDFDYYMFDKVCEKLAQWKDGLMKNVSISCNITRITISQADFLAKVQAIMSKYDFDPSKLVMEITEDAIEVNIEIAKDNIIKMKELGFTIALDDIGSGYTSVVNILEYPIDVVKIDRNVLLKADTEKGRALFLGIAALFNTLGLKIVCEGVETEEQNELVKNSECHYIQGWYYAKAMPVDKAEEFFLEYSNQRMMTNAERQ